MNNVVVLRSKLVEKLKENSEKHRLAYEEAANAYEENVRLTAKKLVAVLEVPANSAYNALKETEWPVHPVDHGKDYKLALALAGNHRT